MVIGSAPCKASIVSRGFAVLGALRGKFHAFRGNGKFHGAGTLVSKLADAANGVIQFVALEHDKLRLVIARHHRRIIRELSGKDARYQSARADAEK